MGMRPGDFFLPVNQSSMSTEIWSMLFESRPALITSFLSSSTCGNLSWLFSACCFSWARDGGLWKGDERRRRMGERKKGE